MCNNTCKYGVDIRKYVKLIVIHTSLLGLRIVLVIPSQYVHKAELSQRNITW